jgi:arabinose-5-phosphate isomerase
MSDSSYADDKIAHRAAARETIQAEAAGLVCMADAIDGALGAAFVAAVEALAAAQGRAIITGMGKSGHIARKIAATLASTGRPAFFVHPAEASHGDLGMITPVDCVLAISRSGEAPELSDIVHHCRRLHIPLIAMTFRDGSTLARAADIALVLPECGEASDAAPAPTISTTMCLAMGDALAIALLRAAGFTADHFGAIHPGGKLGATLKRVADVMRTGDSLPLVAPDCPAPDMLAAMGVGKLGCVGIVQDGRLLGVVTDGDLRRRLNAEAFGKTASALMTANPRTIAPDASLADAMALLNDLQINVVFAVEDGRPVGAVHIQDLLTAGVR